MHSLPAYIKKFAALALLGVFVFIQSEKCLHAHSTAAKKHHHTSLSGTNLTCQLCDYQLAADADVPGTIIIINPPVFASEKNAVVSVFIISGAGNETAPRGPPSHC